METVGKLTMFILFFVSASLVSLLGAYVVLQIGQIYNLKFVTGFTFVQVYGILSVFAVLRHRGAKEKQKESKKETSKILADGFAEVLNHVIFYLIAWALSYLMYLIIS